MYCFDGTDCFFEQLLRDFLLASNSHNNGTLFLTRTDG